MSTSSEQEDRQKESRRIWSADIEDRHTSHCRVLPTRERLLDILPKNGVIAEVGVAFGDFSAEILSRAAPEKLYLVDAWENDRYSEGRERVRGKFAEQIATGKVIIREGLSVDVLPTFPDDYFDFLYIDTSHSFDVTLAELEIGNPKVRAGGLIAGHDFCVGNIVAPVVYGVIQACNKFCREHDWRYKYLTLETGGTFSFALEKI